MNLLYILPVIVSLMAVPSPADHPHTNVLRCDTPHKIMAMVRYREPDVVFNQLSDYELESLKENAQADLHGATSAFWFMIPETQIAMVHVFRDGCRFQSGRMGINILMSHIGKVDV